MPSHGYRLGHPPEQLLHLRKMILYIHTLTCTYTDRHMHTHRHTHRHTHTNTHVSTVLPWPSPWVSARSALGSHPPPTKTLASSRSTQAQEHSPSHRRGRILGSILYTRTHARTHEHARTHTPHRGRIPRLHEDRREDLP